MEEDPAVRPWSQALKKRGRISGTGFISWKSAQENIAAPGVLIIEAPDRMRLEVQDPVGGIHALLIVNGSRFFWFGAEEPHNWVGPVHKLSKVTSLSGEHLIRALAGTPDAKGFIQKSRGVFEKSTRAEIEQVGEGAGGDLADWSAHSKNGSWRLKVEYENYAVRFGVPVPFLVRLELLEAEKFKSRLTWTWSEFRLEGAADNALLQIPAGAAFGKTTRSLR